MGDGGDPVGDLGDHAGAGGVDVGEDVEGHHCRGRLAARAPHVGLEGMAEPTVTVLIRRERGQHGLDRPVVEKDGELVAFQDTGAGFDELSSSFQVDTHAPEARRR
ncbi:hypothetical protein ACWCW7_10465 [Nocardia tengchongensis]